MKKIFTLSFLLPFYIINLFSQVAVTGSKEYGRLFDVTYDAVIPNKLYAVTLANHIVTSNDNGGSWSLLYSFPNTRAVIKDLKLLPNNQLSFNSRFDALPSVYVLDLGTLQIVKTITPPIPDFAQVTTIESYDIFPGNTNIALVHQSYSIDFENFAKVYYTTNAGITWNEVYFNVNYDSVFPNNVAINPENQHQLFIARGLGPLGIDGGLFVSTNAGLTWEEKLPGITFDAIAFKPENPNFILLGTGFFSIQEGIFQSADAGQTWSQLPITFFDDILNNINVIKYDPNYPDRVIALEENEIIYSADNFMTWSNFVYPVFDVHSYYQGLNVSYNPYNVGEVYISADFHVLHSLDNGETVQWAKNPYFVSTGPVELFYNGLESHLYYGVQSGFVHRNLLTATDTPHQIRPLDYFSNDPGLNYRVEPKIPGQLYTISKSGFDSQVFVSFDHGETNYLLFTASFFDVSDIKSFPNNPNIIWVLISDGYVSEIHQIDFSNLSNIQHQLVNFPYTGAEAAGFQFNSANQQEAMVIVGSKVFKTTDGGSNWSSSTNGLEALQYDDLIFRINQNPLNRNQYTIATSKGIFTSTDSGNSWQRVFDGIVHHVEHSPKTNGHLIAVTHDSDISLLELRFSNDGGTNWAEVPKQNLNYIGSTASAFNFQDNSAKIYFGSFDMGLVEFDIDFSVLSSPDFNKNPEWLTAYPNPTNNFLILKTKNEEINVVNVLNVSGQVVLSESGNQINFSKLTKGIYIVNVVSKSGKTAVKKIVKN